MTPRYLYEDENTGWWICEHCGVVVQSRGAHNDLHSRLDRLEKDLAYVRQLAEF